MLARILSGIVIYAALAVFVYLLARLSIRYEMSKHLEPPYHLALPFLKTMYFLGAVPAPFFGLDGGGFEVPDPLAS